MNLPRAILIAVMLGFAAVISHAASISGTVTFSGAALEGVSVDVYAWEGADPFGVMVASVLTGLNGTYSAVDLPAGNYRVGFRDNSGVYAPVFYVSANDIYSATDIPLTATQAVSGIDAALSTASSIGGTVTAADGLTPLESISVTVFRFSGGNWEFVGGQISEVDGTFVVNGLAAGAYRVEFYDSLGAYAGEYYNNRTTFALADTVNVPAATAVTGIDASLSPASSISGKVTGPGGASLSGITVSVLAFSVSQDAWIFASSGSTDASGNYTVGGLSAGNYRVEFSDIAGSYAKEYYNDAADVASAADVAVGVGTTISGINASLSLAGYDSWATDYGLDPATDGASGADYDRDSFTNGSEYAFGTDPTVATSALLAANRVAGKLVVTYLRRDVGITYLPKTSATLGAGSWAPYAGTVVPSPNQDGVPLGYSRVQQTIPGSGKLFFRVEASWN